MVGFPLEELSNQRFPSAAGSQELSVRELVPVLVILFRKFCLLGAHATWILVGIRINNKENKHM